MLPGPGSAAGADAARARLRSPAALELGAVERIVEGDRPGEGPLAGVPLLVKDLLDVAGVPTTAGSAGWVRRPDEDAASVAALRRAGAVVVAKGHTNEWAYGIDGRNPHRPPCRHPEDPRRLPGGSSSGPAVAVAAGLVAAGLGTDTSGSLRVPAALCGIVALRPGHGAVPTAGCVPLAPTYDVVGPLAGSVAGVAALQAVLAGDPALRTAPELAVAGRTVGVLGGGERHPTVCAAAGALAEAGVALVALAPRLTADGATVHAVVQPAEAAAVHARWWPGQEYAPEVRERIERGRGIEAWRYLEAQRSRRELVAELFAEMRARGADALLTITTEAVAPRRDGDAADDRADLLRHVVPLSQTGGPVLAVPTTRDEATNLPLGVQLAGPPRSEALLLALGAALERALPGAGSPPARAEAARWWP